jgi:hypothetical protein
MATDGKLPPSSNTGAKSQAGIVIGFGWLQGSFPSKHVSDVLQRLREEFGDPVAGRGLFYRSASMEFPFSVRVAYDEEEGVVDDVGKAVLAVPASALESLAVERQRNLVGFLRLLGFHGTRLDASADDCERSILPRQVFEEGREKRKVCGFKAEKARIMIGEIGYKGRSGDTAYFGRRGNEGSGRCVRVYEKSVESEGEIDAVRWEVEFADGCAAKAFEYLATASGDADFVSRLAALVTGSIDFREKDKGYGNGTLDSMPQAEWWRKLVERIGEAYRVVYKRAPSTLSGISRWMCEAGPAAAFRGLRVLWQMAGNAGVPFHSWWMAQVEGAEISRRMKLLLRAEAKSLGVLCPV